LQIRIVRQRSDGPQENFLSQIFRLIVAARHASQVTKYRQMMAPEQVGHSRHAWASLRLVSTPKPLQALERKPMRQIRAVARATLLCAVYTGFVLEAKSPRADPGLSAAGSRGSACVVLLHGHSRTPRSMKRHTFIMNSHSGNLLEIVTPSRRDVNANTSGR
jgi:hypothetical protein